MSPSRSFLLTLMLTAALSLAACDDAAQDTASTAQAAPQAGDELPVASNPAVVDNPDTLAASPVTAPGAAGSSMAEDSPGGEAVTEQELPPQADMPPPPSREVFADAECSFETWVGAKVDEAAVKATGRPYRILKPGSMMTMDHNPERINVEHGDDGNVTRVWCG